MKRLNGHYLSGKVEYMHRRSRMFTIKAGLVVITLIAVISYLSLGRYKFTTANENTRVLIPDQTDFRANNDNMRAVKWIAERWSVNADQIYMIVEDSEQWMQVIGLLDLQTLSSAKIWIIDSEQPNGQRWVATLTERRIPYKENLYLVNEYRPSEIEKRVAARFYSTITYWYGNPVGGLAIIEDLVWNDTLKSPESITVYQSQKYLPSITVPIKNGLPQKLRAYQTPIDSGF